MNEHEPHAKRTPETVRYDSAEAPAAGAAIGLDRQRIEDVAEHYRIPLYEDSGVVEALARLDISSTIPTELYGVIAEVLAYVYRTDNS